MHIYFDIEIKTIKVLKEITGEFFKIIKWKKAF